MNNEITVSVLSALRAYKEEGGMKPSDAENWANSHLTEGVSRFEANLVQGPSGFFDRDSVSDAFSDLKAWAQS